MMEVQEMGAALGPVRDTGVWRWDKELAASGLRLSIERPTQGEPGYVLLVDRPDGSTLMHRARHADADEDRQLRQHAYSWLARNDPYSERRAYWEVRARCPRAIETESFYEQVAALNIVFGPSFRAVREIWRGRQEAIGRVELAPDIGAQAGAYIHHPVFLDACLQLFGATLYGEMSRKTFLPVGMESFYFEPGPVSFAWSHVRLRNEVALEDKSALADFLFFDRELRQIGEIVGFSLRLSDRMTLLEHDAAAGGNIGYHMAWERLERAQGASLAGEDLLVLGAPVRAAALREHLSPATRVLDRATAATARGAVIVVEADGPGPVPDPQATAQGAWQLLETVRGLGLERSEGALARLWFVTQSTQQVTGHDAVQPQQAFAWALARCIEREYPHVQVLCIDAGEEDDAAALAGEILSGSTETMVAFRGGARYVARLGALATAGANEPQDDGPQLLKTRAYGSLDNLYWAPMQRGALGEHDVEIRVCATGLNFKDVLHAMGMLARDGVQSGVEQATAMLFGGDCSGIVERTGSAVRAFKAGDRVMACMAFGSFATHVTVDAHFVAKLPDTMPWHVGAAIPTAYLTAYHALVTRGGLRRGERVLIHSAAGGVGLAAIQVARHLGAEVHATASRSKHGFLRAQGVSGVYDSRSLGFAEQLTREQPQQMDLVLNCLNGAFVEHSFSVLKHGGRFIEIGKIGVWSVAEAAQRRPDARYALFDLMDLAQDRPELLAQEFAAMLRLMEQAGLRPTRVQTFSMGRVGEAFRYMAEARHIGKIVVTQRMGVAQAVRPDRCHVVAGGLGALGRELLDWLAHAGARHVAVVGRREPDEAAHRCFDLLRAQGIELSFVRADLSDRSQADAALKQIAGGSVPIGTIFHLAGVLSDALLRNQTKSSFDAVFQAKVEVAVNLHLASLRTPHEHFVCFSSIAAVFGSPGQTNYAAANAVVDALMHHRRTLGLPGMSVNWGPWAGGGMVHALGASDQARLSETGLKPLQPTEAFDVLTHLLTDGHTQVSVLHADWSRPAAYPGGRVPPFLASLAGDSAAQDGSTDAIDQTLRALPPEERLPALLETTIQCLSKVLRLAPSDIAPHHGLGELGLDSLMGMELRHKLERMIGAPVAISTLLKGPSVEQLAAELLELGGFGTPPAARASAASPWWLRLGGAEGASTRLICFHHLGGSADFFRQWAEPLFDAAEVFAVQLPGRAQRLDETPVVDFETLLAQLLPALEPLFDRPVVLFGHSMGSHLAFEVARLARQRGLEVRHLFASALWSPLAHETEKHGEHLRQYGAIDVPAALRADPHYMQALKTLVAADAALVRSYAGLSTKLPIDVPLSVFSGDQDMIAPPAKVARWSGCTTETFKQTTLPGKHMFLVESAAVMLKQIRSVL
jgi:myxalamid-type polyketide synthase MxaB